MATKTSGARGAAVRAGRAAADARGNPYVQRMIEDPDLRDNVREAFESARHAYKRMSNGKPPTKALLEDKKLQRDLRQATDSLREAADQLRGKRAASVIASAASAAPDRGGSRGRAGSERRCAQGPARQGLRRRGGVRVLLHHQPELDTRRGATAPLHGDEVAAPRPLL